MRSFFANVVFGSHAAFVIFWYGLFFVPTNWWPNKITFHFYFTLGVLFHQFLWGFLIMPWTKKYRLVCILTTLMQILRRQKISDPKNYDHSFAKEFFCRIYIPCSHRLIIFLNAAVLTAVTMQYFFAR